MLLYLDHAWEKFRDAGRMNNMKDLHDAVIEGAVSRVRPKIMAVSAILFGLLPIMWSPATQAGADVMKRIATPMIGGVITSAFLNLLIYPVIYIMWKKRGLKEQEEEEAPLVPPALVPSESVLRRMSRIIAMVLIAAALIYAANFGWHKFTSRNTAGIPFATQTVNDLTITFSSPGGQLKNGDNDVLIEFRDSSGSLIDVGNVKFELNMNMTRMQMHEGANIQPTGAPGRYRAKIKVGMAGDWAGKLSYDGPRGRGETTVTLSAKP